MSDLDEPGDLQDEELDNNVHQVCYVYQPYAAESLDERPKKKRKIDNDSTTNEAHLPRLFRGREPDHLSTQRYDQLRSLLQRQENVIEQLMEGFDNTVMTRLSQFIALAHHSAEKDRLPTGFVVSGPDSSVQNRLQNSWKLLQSDTLSTVLVQVRASSCPNLQTALKNVIRSAITEAVGPDGYATFIAKHKRLIPMNYDLELLQLFVREKALDKVIISIIDVETFDTNVLSQLLWSLSSWTQRIPFVALLGIATTVELFESRLPKSTVTHLKAEVFQMASEDDLLYKVYEAVQYESDGIVFLGPSTISAFYEASQSQSTTVEAFISIVRVAYMSFYFANSLALLAAGIPFRKQETDLVCEAIRNTDSFRQHCKALLNEDRAQRLQVEKLLSNDPQCLKAATTAVADGQAAVRSMLQIIQGLKDLYRALGMKKASPFLIDIELYNNCDQISTTEIFEEVVTAITKLSSDKLLKLLGGLSPTTLSHLNLADLYNDLSDLHRQNSGETIQPIYIRGSASSVRTPEISTPTKKSLQSPKSKKKTNASATSVSDQYATLLNALSTQLVHTVDSHGFTFKAFMHEAFVINSRQPLLGIFTPRPRHVLERALSKPADYLGCHCDNAGGNDEIIIGNTDMQVNGQHSAPPSSIVYDLLQEAGTIINVRDLFDAFQSRLDPLLSSNKVGLNGTKASDVEDDNEEAEDEEDEQDESDGRVAVVVDDNSNAEKRRRIGLCLFYRSLAELKMLGMVKSSTSTMTKKRALASETGSSGGVNGKGKRAYAEIDFIAKTSWAGL